MSRAHQPFETLEGHGLPTVRQISVFLENRVGQLLRLTHLFDDKHIRTLGLTVYDSVDFAVARLVLTSADDAAKALKEAGFAFTVKELLVVLVPPGERGLERVFSALISAEINIGYAYALLTGKLGPAIALSVDDIEGSMEALRRHKFALLSELDLQQVE